MGRVLSAVVIVFLSAGPASDTKGRGMSQLQASTSSSGQTEKTTPLHARIVDADTGRLLPARLYIQSSEGRWFWARSQSPEGSAVEYRKQRSPKSVEMHTTLSAHPFVADLPPGDYTVSVERGKEYRPVTQSVHIGQSPVQMTFELRRWINLAERGWYSGDTHVHRTLDDLPNVMLAEDLNVALPLTYWVTTAYTPPGRGNKNAPSPPRTDAIEVDPTHVIYPVNTEYEIFSVGKQRHTLGAVFVLNHKTPLKPGVPPVRPVAEEARRQGAILDLDKHSWPWSLMLMPIMNVDLFELANNHIWRTEFAFGGWTIDTKPDFVDIETGERGWTEWGWTSSGFETYYLLLNCGFRLRPTAGTASGVHPVPLGFGRVYVQLNDGFRYKDWIAGLDAGRSFVTTGPMLFVEFNKRPPGTRFDDSKGTNSICRVSGCAESLGPLDRIEIIVNGQRHTTIEPLNQPTSSGGHKSPIDETLRLAGSSWVAVRCFERLPDRRLRFAHSSPVHFDVADKPLRPRRVAVEYLIRRMTEELERNKTVLATEDLDEYREALRVYQEIAKRAR